MYVCIFQLYRLPITAVFSIKKKKKINQTDYCLRTKVVTAVQYFSTVQGTLDSDCCLSQGWWIHLWKIRSESTQFQQGWPRAEWFPAQIHLHAFMSEKNGYSWKHEWLGDMFQWTVEHFLAATLHIKRQSQGWKCLVSGFWCRYLYMWLMLFVPITSVKQMVQIEIFTCCSDCEGASSLFFIIRMLKCYTFMHGASAFHQINLKLRVIFHSKAVH